MTTNKINRIIGISQNILDVSGAIFKYVSKNPREKAMINIPFIICLT